MEERKISVDTPFGKLIAVIGNEVERYPSVYVYIQRPDGEEIDLVVTEVNVEDNLVKAFLYGNTGTDSYTAIHTWDADEINIDMD